ncbi:MAG: Asp-tRNA(Asn)/Glu-tRNA(Gln) amidotransferase subunit GatB [Dokdonella sp.]
MNTPRYQGSTGEWQAVIGLEIHTQLATKSKIFSGASTAYGAEPNSQACAVDVALPGTLPVPNHEAIRMALGFGLAIGAEIERVSMFARKNYFYPDSPKGYQISQFDRPIVGRGRLQVRRDDDSTFDVLIERAHLEEDAGKSLHDAFAGKTGIDLNRAGTPLLEIVSAPVLHSPADAVAYMRTVHRLVRWIGICDGNMQEGSFRCDANVSVRRAGDETLGIRSEVKNVNSFRFVEKAIAYEIERQIRALESGTALVQETRLYDAAHDRTRSMRSKEDADDYRYFPDPDLPPIRIDPNDMDAVRADMPELPDARRQRYIDELGLPVADAEQLCMDRATSDYFEDVQRASGGAAKPAANWVLGELAAALNANELTVEHTPITADALGSLLRRIDDGVISGKQAKEVFAAMLIGESDADAVIAARGMVQVSDEGALLAAIDTMLAANPAQVTQFRDGNDKVFGYLVGQAMKATRGTANPKRLNELLRSRLNQAD